MLGSQKCVYILYFEIFTPEQSIIVSGQVLRMGICSFSVRREIFYISQTAAAAAVTFVVHVLLKTPTCVERCKIFIQYLFNVCLIFILVLLIPTFVERYKEVMLTLNSTSKLGYQSDSNR